MTSLNRPFPRALSIAGSDSGGGAGIQADLKTFQAFGVYGMSAITAVTAQNTLSVLATHPIPSDVVESQIVAVLEDIGVDAVKTGMLSNAEVVETVASQIQRWKLQDCLVVDPVMVSTSGQLLLEEQGVRAMIQRLLPLAAVLTPNIPEAEVLLKRVIETDADIRAAGADLLQLGPKAVFLKGGHRSGDAVDLLFYGAEVLELFAHRVPGKNTHGTGCTLSAAIAAGLALGFDLRRSVTIAKQYVTGAIEHAPALGAGHGPLAHDWPLSRPGLSLG